MASPGLGRGRRVGVGGPPGPGAAGPSTARIGASTSLSIDSCGPGNKKGPANRALVGVRGGDQPLAHAFALSTPFALDGW